MRKEYRVVFFLFINAFFYFQTSPLGVPLYAVGSPYGEGLKVLNNFSYPFYGSIHQAKLRHYFNNITKIVYTFSMNGFFNSKLKVFKNADFSKLISSQFLSLTGGYIQNVALSALISSGSDKRWKLGLFLFVSYLPVCLISFFASKLISKISPVRILFVTELVLFSMSVLLFLYPKMSYPLLLLFGGVWGVVRAFQTPAVPSIPKLICYDADLAPAISALSLAQSLARAIGPIVSGVLYSTLDYTACFAMNVLTYIPSVILIFKISPITPAPAPKSKPKTSPSLLISVFLLSMTATAYNIIFTGITVSLHLSKLWFSIFMATLGLGAAIGWFLLKKDKPAFLACLVISALAIVLAFSKSTLVILPVITVYGVCDYFIFTSAIKTLQLQNDKSSLPRAMGAYTACTTGALPVGFLISGILCDVAGVRTVLVEISVVTAAVYLLFLRKMR